MYIHLIKTNNSMSKPPQESLCIDIITELKREKGRQNKKRDRLESLPLEYQGEESA
jgi:hypothetical protein